jgi:hypothetical protein
MKNHIRILKFYVIFSLSISLFFTGCSDTDEPGNLDGTWISVVGDAYIIDTLNNIIEYQDNFIGKIVNSPNYNASNGVLIIEITKYWDADWSNWPDVTYTETTVNNGKFAATYWRNLTDKSVQTGNAWLEETEGIWVHVMFDTFSEAQTNFTMDRVGIYIGNWGSYSLE